MEKIDFAKLITQRDTFITAAINAENPSMKALWIHRAEKWTQKIEEAKNRGVSECVIQPMSL